jgi:hypothetical protein
VQGHVLRIAADGSTQRAMPFAAPAPSPPAEMPPGEQAVVPAEAAVR